MNLVVPYTNDHNDGHELRYCIRSMVKYFTDLTGVCIIGDKPTWYRGEYIPAKDTRNRKELSIVAKVLLAPYEDFLLCCDDVYALKPFDRTLPLYYSCKLKDYKGLGSYPERVRNVMQIYPEGNMYGCHCPMVINMARYRKANSVDWAARDYLMYGLYGNFIGGGVRVDDFKVRSKDKLDLTREFFSTNTRSVRFFNLDELFPDKSKYEG